MSTLSPTRNKRVVAMRQDILAQIQCGALEPDAPVMSAAELAKRYTVSYPTAHRVLAELSDRGYLYRIQGKGTFVAPNSGDAAMFQKDQVALFMRSGGHLFSSLFKHLSQPLQDGGFLTLTMDTEAPSFVSAPERAFLNVLRMKPWAWVVDGAADFPFGVLKRQEHAVRHLVVVNNLYTELSLNADVVITDDERGGYLAMQHLLELGHRRVVMEVYGGAESGNIRWRPARLRLQGARKAMREANLPSDALTLLNPADKQVEAQFRACFSVAPAARPTAVLAAFDYRVRQMLVALREMGLRVPQDVSIMGYYNTPWCEMMDVALTSVSIKEAYIARLAVERILTRHQDERIPTVHMAVEPEVVRRASTAPVAR